MCSAASAQRCESGVTAKVWVANRCCVTACSIRLHGCTASHPEAAPGLALGQKGKTTEGREGPFSTTSGTGEENIIGPHHLQVYLLGAGCLTNNRKEPFPACLALWAPGCQEEAWSSGAAFPPCLIGCSPFKWHPSSRSVTCSVGRL